MKHKQKGNSIFVIILLVVVAGIAVAVGYYVYRQTSAQDVNDQSAMSSAPSQETANKPVATGLVNQKKFDSKYYAISFMYPDTWNVEEMQTGDYKTLTIKTPNYSDKALLIGGVEVVNGAQVSIATYDTKGQTLEQYYKQGLVKQLIDSGTLTPRDVQLGSYDAVEAVMSYEGSVFTQTWYLLSPDKVVVGTYRSKDNDQSSQTFKEYQAILASVKAQ